MAMPVRSVVILANALEIWRQIEKDNAVGRSSWVFEFQSSCPQQANAKQLIEDLSKSFTSSLEQVEESESWIVKATSSVQHVEMSQSRLSKWANSAKSLSEASGCQLTAWEIMDVYGKKAYRNEAPGS